MSIKGLRNILAAVLVFCTSAASHAGTPDWLLDPSPFVATVERSPDGSRIEIANGLVRRTFLLKPEAATVRLDNLINSESLLRSPRPEARVQIDGIRYAVGGLTGQPIHNYLAPEWEKQLRAETNTFHLVDVKTGAPEAAFPWKKRLEWMPFDPPWPVPGVSLTLVFAGPAGLDGLRVEVHYTLLNGLPAFSKWVTLHNGLNRAVRLDTIVVEELALVEPESIVDGPAANFRGAFRMLDVVTDYSFGGQMSANADAPAVHWKSDPLYSTQVHYERQTPCLLECSPPVGPDVKIGPGETFESFRVFELVQDSTDRERRGLATRRAYRMWAPWVQENPILMHVRSARSEAVKLAIDQCSEMGFEMVIMTFGSGFDIENDKPEYLAGIKELAEDARRKKIVLGGYSLLASRSINAANDVINPKTGKTGGARFGESPCLGSEWGQRYFEKIRNFFKKTGCAVLEHDGSYPGDLCASEAHPGHKGLNDSQWCQWRIITGLYQWCRARGIYLNVPDWYYLAGSTKCAMGYRETNWSLPREQQEVIERQNIYDGTWEKTPSMGWMFVPLTEYQGGGAAATIEPLREHLEHYEARLANLFGAGVQACYRGPRLYDSEQTKPVVKRWVDFYKEHRAILDSDIIHLRRPDGSDWDGWLHVNPRLPECGLAVFYNPLNQPIERQVKLPLYYTGLVERATLRWQSGEVQTIALSRDYSADVSFKVPSRSRVWVVVQKPETMR